MAVADNIRILTELGPHPFISPRNFPAADCVLARLLAASTAESITVPGTLATAAKYVRISATDDIFISFTTTATVPGDTVDGTASELLSKYKGEHWFFCAGVTTISVISAGTPIVTASFYTG